MHYRLDALSWCAALVTLPLLLALGNSSGSAASHHPLVLLLAYSFTLIALAVYDWRTGLLPDSATLSLLWLGLVSTALFQPSLLQDAVWGAALGYLLPHGLNLAYRCTAGRDGLGGGDCKLLAAIGAWQGVHALPWIVVIFSCAALVVQLLRAWRHPPVWHQPFALGPFITMAALGAMHYPAS